MKKGYNVEVIVDNRDDDIEKYIKRFARKVKKCGVIEEVLEKRYYEKPSRKKYKKKKFLKKYGHYLQDNSEE